MRRIGYLDDDRINHGYVGTNWHSIIKKSSILKMPFRIVDILFIQRPPNPLDCPALVLSFNIRGVYGFSGVLYYCIAQNFDSTCFSVDIYIDDMSAKAWRSTLYVL